MEPGSAKNSPGLCLAGCCGNLIFHLKSNAMKQLTPIETRMLMDHYRREWKREFDFAEQRERLEMERERLQNELLSWGSEMPYGVLIRKKRRIEEINDIFSPQTKDKC